MSRSKTDVPPIQEHAGKKYIRRIYSVNDPMAFIEVDVYAVLDAFEVDCQATAHAIKKLLCAGLRGKGDRLADLEDTPSAVFRAIEMERGRAARAAPKRKKDARN